MPLSGVPFPGFEPTPQPVADTRPESVVLVVEDEVSLGELLVQLLARMKLRALRALDGETALQLFAQEAEPIRFAFIDCNLPDMDGAELARELRTRSPKLPLLLTSGRDQRVLVKALSAQGPTVFLQKPYMPADVSRQVNALLSEAV